MIVPTTRTAARHLVVAALSGAAGLALFAGPLVGAADAATPCTTAACISNFSVQAGGQSAAVVFDTATPTKEHFEVSYNNAVVAQANHTDFVSHHQISTPASLDPNRTYTWLLQVTDKDNHSVSRAGTVTTLHRQVDVMFSTITVTNDSDADSAGDFRTWVRAGSVGHVDVQVPDSISSGSTVLATHLIRTRDAGNTLPVYTEMLDNDTFNPFLPSSQWPSPTEATWNNGSSVAWDWATAMATLDTRNATNGLVPFTMSVNANVGFVVHGYYSVTFVS